jgi:hypothetical protein
MVPAGKNVETDARGASRASIFLAAVLYHDGTSYPVKIRNISPTGALVEGPAIPPATTPVELVRGGLVAHGLVAWSLEGRCGLKFSSCVDVQQWRATPTNSEQKRVDEVVRLVKAGAVPLPVSPIVRMGSPGEAMDRAEELAGDLSRALELLNNLGAALAGDREVVTRHCAALQKLDIAMQVIAAVGATVAGRGDAASDAAKLSGLRKSMDQALQQRS